MEAKKWYFDAGNTSGKDGVYPDDVAIQTYMFTSHVVFPKTPTKIPLMCLGSY